MYSASNRNKVDAVALHLREDAKWCSVGVNGVIHPHRPPKPASERSSDLTISYDRTRISREFHSPALSLARPNMHLHSPSGEPCVHVPHSSDGQRLQRFASQAFREELGRGGGHLHGACKHAAHQGTFLVNGAERPGRHVLSSGDVVTLAKRGALGEPVTAATAPRSRMEYAGAQVAEPEAGPAAAAAAVRLTGPFASYYAMQRLCEPDEWARVEAASASPLPLSLRPNGSVPSQLLAVAALQRLLCGRLRPVPWLPSALWAAPAGDGDGDATSSQEAVPHAAAAAAAVSDGAAGATRLLLEAQVLWGQGLGLG